LKLVMLNPSKAGADAFRAQKSAAPLKRHRQEQLGIMPSAEASGSFMTPGGIAEVAMQSVLAAIDFSTATPAVIQAAAEMARRFGCGLYVVHVDVTDSIDVRADLEAPVGRAALAEQLREEHRELLAVGDDLRSQGSTVVTLLRRSPAGDVAGEILKEAERLKPMVIVIGSHGHGALHHLLLGGVSTGVLHRAACPVLVVPSRPSAPAEP
jgi:nucleotide-binding universal stress UspA family protein